MADAHAGAHASRRRMPAMAASALTLKEKEFKNVLRSALKQNAETAAVDEDPPMYALAHTYYVYTCVWLYV